MSKPCAIGCLKASGKVIAHLGYFAAHFTSLYYSSGAMLYLGAAYYAQNDDTYAFFVSNYGHSIGRTSAAITQWMISIASTALLLQVRAKEDVGLGIGFLLNTALTLLFAAMHYETLPLAKDLALNCSGSLSRNQVRHTQCDSQFNDVVRKSFYTGFGFVSIVILIGFPLLEALTISLGKKLITYCQSDNSQITSANEIEANEMIEVTVINDAQRDQAIQEEGPSTLNTDLPWQDPAAPQPGNPAEAVEPHDSLPRNQAHAGASSLFNAPPVLSVETGTDTKKKYSKNR